MGRHPLPIGRNDAPFLAIFLGNERTVGNLYIRRSTDTCSHAADVGLFGHTGTLSAIRELGLMST